MQTIDIKDKCQTSQELLYRIFIYSRFIESKINLQNSIKKLKEAILKKSSDDIVNYSFMVADAKDKYVKAKNIYRKEG